MMPVAERELTSIEKALDGLDDLLIYRYPHIVGPPFVALLALGLAEAAYLGGHGTAILLTVVIAVVCLLAVDSVLRLPGQRERAYAALCWGCGGLWTAVAAFRGPVTGGLPVVHLTAYSYPIPPMLAVWATLLVLAWPPWVKHRRIRRGVAVAAEILAWDGDAVGLPEVDLSAAGAKANGDDWEAPLVPQVRGKWTTEKLRRAIPNIASHYQAAAHEFSIDKVSGDKEGKWVLRYRKAMKREPVVYQAPAERPSARKPFTIGHVTADPTQPLQAEVYQAGHGGLHTLVTGQTGYGKTTFLQRVGLHAVASGDCLLFLGDMKPGSPDYSVVGKRDRSAGIGTRGAYLYATSASEIDLMVLILLALCRIRGRSQRRSRKVIVVLLDETALYFDPTPAAGPNAADRARAYQIDMQRLAKFQSLAAVARGYDIAIWIAVQKGKEKNTGADARAALSAGQAVAFYAPKASDGALVSSDPGFDPTRLPRGTKGQCLISNSLHPEVVRGTLWNVTDKVIREVLDRFADDQSGLDADELEALRKEFGAAWDDLRLANRGTVAAPVTAQVSDDEPESPAPQADTAEPAQSRAVNADQSRQAAWDALATFTRPASVREVAEVLGKSEPMTRARLSQLVDAGRAIRHGQGRWVKYVAVRVGHQRSSPSA